MQPMDFEKARFNMVEQQVRPWDVLDQSVLDLLFVVKREDFVPAALRSMAFVDTELPLPDGQCMLAPRVEARLLAFERQELRAEPGWMTHLRQVTLLPVQQWITYVRCVAELQRQLHKLAAKNDWSASDLRRRKRHARRLVDRYLNAVVRVAQYTAFERLFALWHLAHLPFVYLLIISAVVHVIAVHAY